MLLWSWYEVKWILNVWYGTFTGTGLRASCKKKWCWWNVRQKRKLPSRVKNNWKVVGTSWMPRFNEGENPATSAYLNPAIKSNTWTQFFILSKYAIKNGSDGPSRLQRAGSPDGRATLARSCRHDSRSVTRRCLLHSPARLSVRLTRLRSFSMKKRLTWPLTCQVDDTGLLSNVWRHERIAEGISHRPLYQAAHNRRQIYASVQLHLHLVWSICMSVFMIAWEKFVLLQPYVSLWCIISVHAALCGRICANLTHRHRHHQSVRPTPQSLHPAQVD